MNKKNLIILLAMVSLRAYSQSDEDIFSFNYTLAPTGNDAIDFHKTDFKLNIPLKLEKGILKNSVKLNYYQFDFRDINFNTEELEHIYNLSYDLSYNHLINNKWKLNTTIGVSIASNFASNLSSSDIFFNGSLAFIKNGGTEEKPSQFTFGAMYSTITGEPRILPLISYKKTVNQKFSFQLGFPKAYVKYKLDKMSTFKASIVQDGYYGNLSKFIYTSIDEEVNKMSFSATSLGLEYNYWMGEYWTIVFKGGYSAFNNYKVDNSQNNSTYNFNVNDQPYFSTGVKFNF